MSSDKCNKDGEYIKKLLIDELEKMPDEAFTYLLVRIPTFWPDGLGGFNPKSQESIMKVRKLALEVLNAS